MNQEPKQQRAARVTALRLMGGMLSLIITAPAVAAQRGTLSQGPSTLRACYVPGSGTIYRIGASQTPGRCVDAGHIEFSLGGMNEMAGKGPGTPAPDDHGSLAGLQDDDHPQYLLSGGVRTITNGFAVAGVIGQGTAPVVPAGASGLLFDPGTAAFRVGRGFGDQWSQAKLGQYSVSFGESSTATGSRSFAIRGGSASGDHALALGGQAEGYLSTTIGGAYASGGQSVAIGGDAAATSTLSIAIGNGAVASGIGSTALGFSARASGMRSMAFGQGNTNDKLGAFVFGDHFYGTRVSATVDNQFVVRAQKIWLGTNNSVTGLLGRFLETSTGAYLSAGGTWTNTSDSTRKTAFAEVDGEEVLTRLAAMPIQTWSYREEDAAVRHMGPTAQHFRAAFQLGQTETEISTVDGDGVALAAARRPWWSARRCWRGGSRQ